MSEIMEDVGMMQKKRKTDDAVQNGGVAETALEFDMDAVTVQDGLDFSSSPFALTKQAEIIARVIKTAPSSWDKPPAEMLQNWMILQDVRQQFMQALTDAKQRPDDFHGLNGVEFVAYEDLSVQDVEAFYTGGLRGTAQAFTKLVTSAEHYRYPDQIETYMQMSWREFHLLQYQFIDYLGDFRKKNLT